MTSKSHAPEAKPPAAKAAAKDIGDRPHLVDAIEEFLKRNLVFESNATLRACIDDIEKCADLDAAFCTALRHRVVDTTGALRFILFLNFAPKLVNGYLDEPEAPLPAFSPTKALELMNDVLDRGVDDIVVAPIEDALGVGGNADGSSDESEDEGEGDAPLGDDERGRRR